MIDNKLTDNEIIKALEDKFQRVEYPWVDSSWCDVEISLLKNAIDLINRQQAEIEEFNELYTNLKNASVQHCVDNEKDRQLLGEYQNIFLELGYSTEVFDPELTEIKAWKDRMIWNCKKSNEMHTEIQNLKQRIKNANDHEIHIMKALKTAKSEAVKEFAERLKALDRLDVDVSYGYGREHYTEAIAVNLIDNLVKEMVGK